MKPKAVEEMTIRGLKAKATYHFEQVGTLSSRMMFHQPGSQRRMEFAALILVERINHDAAVAELAAARERMKGGAT